MNINLHENVWITVKLTSIRLLQAHKRVHIRCFIQDVKTNRRLSTYGKLMRPHSNVSKLQRVVFSQQICSKYFTLGIFWFYNQYFLSGNYSIGTLSPSHPSSVLPPLHPLGFRSARTRENKIAQINHRAGQTTHTYTHRKTNILLNSLIKWWLIRINLNSFEML